LIGKEARIFLGSIDLKLESFAVQGKERLQMLVTDIGVVRVPVVVFEENGGQDVHGRRFFEYAANAYGSGEHRPAVRDTPAFQFSPYRLRRILDDKGRKTLLDDALVRPFRGIQMFHSVFHPPENVLAQKQQHASFLIAPVNHSPNQDGFFLIRGDETLQSQGCPRALHEIPRLTAASKRVKNQRR
jgi:hypothetical protein